MKTKKNTTKKEQITAQVENQEIVAKATEVTNPSSAQVKESPVGDTKAIASEKKDKKSKTKKNKSAQVVEIPAAKSKKKKDKVVKEVAKKQKSSIKEKVVSEREVKYIYPQIEDEDTGEIREMTKDEKKSWRGATRTKYRSLEREIHRFINDQNSKEYKAAKKAFEAYAAKVLKPGVAI